MFDPRLRRYQDWDLAFRLIQSNVALVLLPEPTTMYHPEIAGNISNTRSNMPSLRFLAKHKAMMSARTITRFVTLQIIRRHRNGIGLIRYLILSLLLRSVSLREALAYLYDQWFSARFVPQDTLAMSRKAPAKWSSGG